MAKQDNRVTNVTVQLSKSHGITALVLCSLPVLVLLGNWQLQRADEKQSILEQMAERRAQTPKEIITLDRRNDLAFQPVKLHGVFDNDHNVLLDNRVHAGQVGYDVLTPFIDESGQVVLINRGWIKAEPTRDQLPSIPMLVNTSVTVVGEIYVAPDGAFQLGEEEIEANAASASANWPRVVQALDTERLGVALGVSLFPHQVRISADQVGALVTDWAPINVSPEKHRAYAVQWFAMAIALLLWYLFANTNLMSLLRQASTQKKLRQEHD